MKSGTNKASSTVGRSKRLIFNTIIVLFPFLLLFLVEILLRTFSYGDNLSLFVNHPEKEFSEYRIVNPIVGKKYFQRFEYTEPPKDAFLKEKPDSCFRIFVMGSSTVVGFPYDNNIMFSRILHEWLRETYPGKKIEVVNTAITAINSFTLLDYMPQILRQEPDAILFYAGHNEFYGAFGSGSSEASVQNPAFIRLHLKLLNFRVYQLTRNIISSVAESVSKTKTAAAKRGTLMSRMAKDADITFGSKKYNEGIENYRKNLDMMLAMANAKKVPVFMSDLVSNIRDLKPFSSQPTSSLKPADFYFDLARQQEAAGDFNAAKENYTKARDYDCVRFRASSDINNCIVELSKKYKNVRFVPTLSLFEANSPNRLVGNNLVTEHVHPNIEGYFLMAGSFYSAIIRSGLLGNDRNIYATQLAFDFMKSYGFTELDYLVGQHRIKNLSYHWPFTDESAGFVDYRKIYKPISFVDSLAFAVMVDNELTLSDAHLKMAEKYEAENNFVRAFGEYNALTKLHPFWPPYFRKAADCLLIMRDLPGAIRFFERSLEFGDDSFYAHFRLGELAMIKNDIALAIVHFEKALTLANTEKINVLSKLYVAYSYQQDKENVARISTEINKMKPGFLPQVPNREYTFLDYIPVQVEDYIVRATEMLKETKIDEAEAVLKESIALHDNHIAHRRLGEIYLKKRDFSRSVYELEMVYNDFNSDPRFLNTLALVYLAMNDKNKASKCIDRIEAVESTYPGLEKLRSFVN